MGNIWSSVLDFLALLLRLFFFGSLLIIVFITLKKVLSTWVDRILFFIDLVVVTLNSVAMGLLSYLFIFKDRMSKGKAFFAAYLVVSAALTLMSCKKLKNFVFVFKVLYSLVYGYYLAQFLSTSEKFAEKFHYNSGSVSQTVLVYIVVMAIVCYLLLGATIKGRSVTQEISFM